MEFRVGDRSVRGQESVVRGRNRPLWVGATLGEATEPSGASAEESGVGERNGSLPTKFGEYVLDNVAITHQLKTIFRI